MASAPQTSSELDLWPYEEARRLADRVGNYEPGRPAVFESGFGPSGLPHLGTMGEVLRPSYVRHAFGLLWPARPQRFVVFIDDMDGLRKVPENIPNREAFTAPPGQAGLADSRSVWRLPRQFRLAHDRPAGLVSGAGRRRIRADAIE